MSTLEKHASIEKREKEQERSHEGDSKTESIEEFDAAFEKRTMSVDHSKYALLTRLLSSATVLTHTLLPTAARSIFDSSSFSVALMPFR